MRTMRLRLDAYKSRSSFLFLFLSLRVTRFHGTLNMILTSLFLLTILPSPSQWSNLEEEQKGRRKSRAGIASYCISHV